MKTVIKSASIVSMDEGIGDLASGDILIEGERIAEIGADLGVIAADVVIDGTDMIAMPGFVNGHLHLWQTALRGIAGDWSLGRYFHTLIEDAVPNYRPTDVMIGDLAGALDQLNSGVTTLVDWCHIANSPEYADAAVDGLLASGIRAVFCYGAPMTILLNPEADHPTDVRRMRKERLASRDALVTMGLALRGPDFAPGTEETDIRLARELDVPATFHIACGKFGPRPESVVALAQAELLGPDINLVHANFLTDNEFRAAANCGASIAITPEVEMQMGLGLPPTNPARDHQVRITLGTDIVTDVSADMFSQMRFLLQTERALRNDKLLQQGEMPEQIEFTIRDVLTMATIEGARAFNLADEIGSLTPGKFADITLLRKSDINMACVRDPVAAIVLHANPANVDTVLVAGVLRKRNGQLTHADYDKTMHELQTSSDYLHAAMVS